MRTPIRHLLLSALAATTLTPTLAAAQTAPSPEELRHDRRDIRDQQRDLRDAQRDGTARDVRDERQDLRDARQDYRDDLRDRDRAYGRDDWRGWRERNANLYNRGTWNAPFRYTAFRPGARIATGYYAPRYVIADPWRYHLPRARYGQQWVRHYNDIVLVDTRRGYVVDVIRGFYR